MGWLVCGSQDVPRSRDWLSAAESDRAGELRFTKRRDEYLLRRWAGKQALASVVGLAPEPGSLARIEVLNHEDGSPYGLVDGAPVRQAISLTDRAGWAVCAVAPESSGLGCDLELVEPRSQGFVVDFLTTAEQDHLARVSASDLDVVTNVLWCAKESALKALATGLRRDSRSVEVRLGGTLEEGSWLTLSLSVDGAQQLGGWWRRDGSFVLTLVSAQPTTPPVRLDGSSDLRSAEPVHPWLERPLAP